MSRIAHKSILERFFPPPSFLLMPAAGVDISDTAIKFLELSHAGRHIEVESFGEESLPEGVVVGGEVHDEARLAEILTAVRARLDTRFVRASLPEQEAYFFRTTTPANATHTDIMNQLEFQLEEHVPLAPSQAIIDYDRSAHEPKKGDECPIGVTVYSTQTVEKYTRAFTAAGLFPVSFEIEAHAILRALVPHGDSGTFMILDFGENSVGLSIVSHESLHFTSTLDIAGADLTKIIMEELSIGREEVGEIKNTVGIAGDEYPKMVARVRQEIDKLADEVARHITYWNTRERQAGEMDTDIEEVMLCGGNANVKGLPEHLERALSVPVVRANVWRNVFSFDEVVPRMPHEVSFSYATAIGLALRDSRIV